MTVLSLHRKANQHKGSLPKCFSSGLLKTKIGGKREIETSGIDLQFFFLWILCELTAQSGAGAAGSSCQLRSSSVGVPKTVYSIFLISSRLHPRVPSGFILFIFHCRQQASLLFTAWPRRFCSSPRSSRGSRRVAVAYSLLTQTLLSFLRFDLRRGNAA